MGANEVNDNELDPTRAAPFRRVRLPPGLMAEERAQATLEYALTVAAFMAMVSSLALLWHAGARGVLARLVEEAASHGFEGLGPLDIALY